MIRKLLVTSLKRSLSAERVHKVRLALGRVNQRLWSSARPKSLDTRLQAARVHFAERSPLREFTARFDDPRINTAFARPAGSGRVEYLYRIKEKCVVEPRFGFVILPTAGIVWQSVSQTDYVPFPTHCTDLGCVPSPLDYLARSRVASRYEPRVASLRTLHENNYWHFLHDTLGKVSFFADHGIPEDIPLVVGANLYDSRFFQEALSRGMLAGRRLIRQDSFYIRADEVVFGAPFPHDRRRFEKTLGLLNAPVPDKNANRKVYLTRARSRGRYVANDDEVGQISREAGFDVVDTDNLTIADQMELFGTIRYLIGVHGAGLTNMIFRRDLPLSLLELFDPGHIAPHYYWLADDFGHAYDALVGESDTASPGGFRIDPA